MRRPRVGLMVGRFQPFHHGHANLVNMMIADCEVAIVCVGSADRPTSRHDPWSFDLRREMIGNVYHRRVKVVPLADIGSEQGSDDWCDYVLGKLSGLRLPSPTVYYTGSVADSRWYVGRFKVEGEPGEATPAQRVDGEPRVLRIVPRDRLPYLPATDVRTYLETRSDGWRACVPAVNHDLVESTYPEAFRVRR